MIRMVSIRQAAKELGMPSRRVYDLIKSGNLLAVQLRQDGTYRISTDEIERIKSSRNYWRRLIGWVVKKIGETGLH